MKENARKADERKRNDDEINRRLINTLEADAQRDREIAAQKLKDAQILKESKEEKDRKKAAKK